MTREYKKQVREMMSLCERDGFSRARTAEALNHAGIPTQAGGTWTASSVCSFGLKHGYITRRYDSKAGKPVKRVVSSPKTILRKAKMTDNDFIKFAIKSPKLSQSTKMSVIEELI